jgi:hypothetical protein
MVAREHAAPCAQQNEAPRQDSLHCFFSSFGLIVMVSMHGK